MSTASPKIIDSRSSSTRVLSTVAMILSAALILAGGLGLIFFQQPLQETQDIRGNAMVDGGEANIKIVQASTYLRTYEPARLDFQINTANIATQGLDLVFNVETEVTDVITFQTYTDSNFEIIEQEIEGTGDGFLVAFKARPRTGSFSSNTDRNFLSLEFTPQRSGDFKISFDTENSVMLRADNSKDTLKTLSSRNFSISGSGTANGKACNEACSSNSECQANHRCYDNRCRLVTNPSSSSCAAPPDLGLQRQCNEYCADTRECASGFTCWYNRCRQPENVESISCQPTSAQLAAQIAQNCNTSCASNADCSANMMCFNKQCRLATNPSSTSCSALSKQTVSYLYGTAPTKGSATASPAPTIKPSTASPSATATPSAAIMPSPTPKASPSPLPTITPVPLPVNTTPQVGWPLIALAAGLGLLLVVLILAVLNALSRGRQKNGPKSAQKNTPSTGYEVELQAKINSLKNQPSVPATSGAPAVLPVASTLTPPPAPQLVPAPAPNAMQRPPATPTPTPTPPSVPPMVAAPAQAAINRPMANPAPITRPPIAQPPTTTQKPLAQPSTPQTPTVPLTLPASRLPNSPLPPARIATAPMAAPTTPQPTPSRSLAPTPSAPPPAVISQPPKPVAQRPSAQPITPPPATLRTQAAPQNPPPTPQPPKPTPFSTPLPATQVTEAPRSARTSSMMQRLRQKSITPPGQTVDVFKSKNSQ